MKIRPPRLNGDRVSVYATRSPHRVNPIGLTCAKIEKIEGATIFLSQIDLIDGTPVIDVKPYIPRYDSVPDAKVPEWIDKPTALHDIVFTDESLIQLTECISKCEYYHTVEDAKEAIIQVLSSDPRGVSLKKKNSPFYAIYLDNLNVIVNIQKDEACIVKHIEIVTNWDHILEEQNRKVVESRV